MELQRERETMNMGIATTAQLLQKQPSRKGASARERDTHTAQEHRHNCHNTLTASTETALEKRSFSKRETETERQPRNTGITLSQLLQKQPSRKEASVRDRQREQEHRHNCYNTHSFHRSAALQVYVKSDVPLEFGHLILQCRLQVVKFNTHFLQQGGQVKTASL